MFGVEVRTKKLSWQEVTEALSAQIVEILQEPLDCVAGLDDESYWDVRFPKPGLSLAQTHALLACADADEAMRIEALPCTAEHETHSTSIGMRLSEALLKRHLQTDWESMMVREEGLYLIGLKELLETPKEPVLQLGDKTIPFTALYFSVQERSISPLMFRTTTTLEKAVHTASTNLFSVCVR